MARKRVTFFSAIQILFLKSVGKIKRQSTQLFIILFVTVWLSLIAINVQAQSTYRGLQITGRETAMPCPEEGTLIAGTQQCLALKGGHGNAVSLHFKDGKEWEKLARESYAAGKFEDAVKYWQQVISAYEIQGDWLNQAISLSNLSLTYQQLGRWQEAEKAIENSINLLPQESKANSAELKAIAQTFDIQGNLQLEQGQVNSALKTWEKSTNIYVKLKDELGRKRSLISQVKAMQELGRYEQACQSLIPVMGLENQKKFTLPNQTCEQLTNSDNFKEIQAQLNSNLNGIQLTGLRLLGDVLRKLGYLDKSRKLLEAVEPLISQQNSSEEKALIWLSLGNTYEALANRNKFLSDFQQKVLENYKLALNSYQKVSDITNISQIKIQAKLNLFSILADEKSKNVNSKEVEDLHLEIVALFNKLPPSRQKVYAEVSLMKSLSKNNQAISSREIIELGEKAVKLAKDLDDGRATAYALGNLGKIYVQKKQWLEAQQVTEKALLLSQNVNFNLPDLAYQWQRQLGIILRDREEKDIDSAIAAYTAAFNTLQSVRNDLVPISRDGQFDFRDEIEPVYRELVDLLLRGEKPDQKNLKQAREVIEALQVAELDNFFRDACVVVNKAEEIDRIADKYDPTAAVIHAIILPDRLAIILKLPGKDDLEYREVYQSKTVVKDTIKNLQLYLSQEDKTYEVIEESKKLYKWLIQPIESLLESDKDVKTLVFALDRPLQVIPMGVLYDEEKEQYLLEKNYDLALVPGLQLIEPKPWEEVQLHKLKVLTGGVDQHQNLEGIDFPKIEKLNEELDGIGNFVETSQKISNEDFTKTNLQKELALANIPIVHIKTHGEFSSDPEKTFIVAFGSLIKSKDLDNLIKTGNEKDRRSIELLVLSACKTAQGDERAALGLSGVAIRAGARSTVSTLWVAKDGTNTEIMVRFYQELSKKGMTRAKALHIAQKAYFEKDSEPYFWAPYIIVGNWL